MGADKLYQSYRKERGGSSPLVSPLLEECSVGKAKAKLTEAVAREPLGSGVATVTATISKSGKMELVVNGKVAATADAACILAQAGDGLQVGDDKIKPVGKYTVTTFAGTINEVKLKLD